MILTTELALHGSMDPMGMLKYLVGWSHCMDRLKRELPPQDRFINVLRWKCQFRVRDDWGNEMAEERYVSWLSISAWLRWKR